MARDGAERGFGVGFGGTGGGRRRRRGGGLAVSRPLVVALLLLLVLPLFGARPAAAQDEEPAIVPIDGSGIAPLDDPNAAPVFTDETVVIAPEPEPVAVEPEPVEIESPPVVQEVAPPPPAAPPAAPAVEWAPPTTVYIPETGHSIDGVFLDLWRGWGGANAFGYPITPEFEENGHIVQYYGYARFEYWPEDPDGNVVHLGALGAEMRPHMIRRGQPGEGTAAVEAALAARAWLPLDADEVEPDGEAWRFVPETGHGVAGAFKALWEYTGEAVYLGNPLTEEYVVAGVTYQVFERGKLAQEPGGDPYLLPAGELMTARYQMDTSPVGQGDLPVYSEDLWVPPPAPEPEPEPEQELESELGAPVLQVDPNAEKWIQISIGQQYLTAWQGNVPVWEGYISTGRAGFDTPTGTYFVNTKIDTQTMEGVLGGEYYNVPDVPWVMYFTDRGHAIHGTYWHANFGTPMSHGCVNLPMDTAAWMYGWAPVGMRVEIGP